MEFCDKLLFRFDSFHTKFRLNTPMYHLKNIHLLCELYYHYTLKGFVFEACLKSRHHRFFEYNIRKCPVSIRLH